MRFPRRNGALRSSGVPVPPMAGDGAQQVIAAIKAQPAPGTDPRELLPATDEQLASVRDTEVGRTFGIDGAEVSRDERVAVIHLGGRARTIVVEVE